MVLVVVIVQDNVVQTATLAAALAEPDIVVTVVQVYSFQRHGPCGPRGGNTRVRLLLPVLRMVR
jgi:hypothetical protein